MSIQRWVVVGVLGGFGLLIGLGVGARMPDSGSPKTPAVAAQCWGSYTSEGRNGPFACAGDGVTPIYSQPITR